MDINYLAIDELEKLDPKQSGLASLMNTQIGSLTATYQTLVSSGWQGASADEFMEIFTELSAIHADVSKKLNEWNIITKALATGTRTGLNNIQTTITSALDGATSGSIGDMTGCNISSRDVLHSNELRKMIKNTNNAIKDVNSAISEANSLSSDYGTSQLNTIKIELEEFETGFGNFQTDIKSLATDFFDPFFEFSDSSTNFSSDLVQEIKRLKNLQPTVIEDTTSPIYRAHEFARVLSSLPEKDRAAIEKLCYDADPQYRKIFFSYIDKISIAGTNGTPDGGAVSLPWYAIYINANDSALTTIGKDKNGKDIKIPAWYETFFHEIGHAIDYATENDPALNEAIRRDIRKKLAETLGNMDGITSDTAIRQEAIDMIMNGKRMKDQPKTSAGEAKKLAFDLQEEYRSKMWGDGTYSGFEIGDVSDVSGIASNNALRGQWGHPDLYDNIPIADTAKLEFFAHGFASGMLGNETKKQAERDYFPESSQILDDLFDEIEEEAENRTK